MKIGFKQLGLGKHLQLTDVDGKHEYYASKNIRKFIRLDLFTLSFS
jgi:hypothetical protein